MSELAATPFFTALAACGNLIAGGEGLVASLFLAGLVGGATHCAGMCGPFVLAQMAARLAAVPAQAMHELHRLAGAAALPYHAGRALTYGLLGAGAAALTDGLIQVTGFRWLAAGMLLAAAALFVANAWPSLASLARVPSLSTGGGLVAGLQGIVRPLFDRPLGARGLMLGILLGFLPCGLVYGALAAAGSSREPLVGFVGMAAFGLGTMPGLIAAALMSHLALRRWRGARIWLSPVLMTASGVLLAGLAWRLIAAGA